LVASASLASSVFLLSASDTPDMKKLEEEEKKEGGKKREQKGR
jgi:hypothetical protein